MYPRLKKQWKIGLWKDLLWSRVQFVSEPYNSDRMLINGKVSEKSRMDDKCLEDKLHKENLEETGCFAQ